MIIYTKIIGIVIMQNQEKFWFKVRIVTILYPLNGFNTWCNNYLPKGCKDCHHNWLSDINYTADNGLVALLLNTV